MRVATRSKALGAVQDVLLVDRFEQHGSRSLDALLLERGGADWTVPPVVLLDPDALDGRRLGASAAPTLMPVAQLLVKVFGIRCRCAPVNPWGTGLARMAGCLPQQVRIDQGGQGRADPRGVAGRRCRNARKLWWDGWRSHGLSRRSLPRNVMPGVAFPPVGPVGRGSPPSSGLGAAKTATMPFSGRFARRSLPDTWPASVRSWCPRGARAVVEASTPRQDLWSPGVPIREYGKETGGSPTFPSYPYGDMPRSSTPVV